MSFAAWQVAALDKQYKREQVQFLRTPREMERTRAHSSEKSVPGTPSKVMIKEANTQLMLMFEKISSLECELEVKKTALDEADSLANDTNKLLEDRVQELEEQSIEKDKAHNAQLVSYQQQCQNQLNVMKEQCKFQMKELNGYIANYQKETQAEVATLKNFKKEARLEMAEYQKSAIIWQDEKDMYEESVAKLDELVSSLLHESDGFKKSILKLEEQIMDYQQEILDLNDENMKLKEHLNSKDRKFSVLLSTETSLLTLVNLISNIKSTKTARKSEKEDLIPQAEPTREEAKRVETETKTPPQEAGPEVAADEAPAEPEYSASEETADEQIEGEVAEVKEEDEGQTEPIIEQSEKCNYVSSSFDLLTDRTENVTAAETSDSATGAKTEPAKPEHGLMEEQEESAQIPATESTPQFELFEHEPMDPQPEILMASSMSGSSFVNVPSCEEVDSYQDISTSSPDLCPSSPNLSHSSTPTGDREDVSDEEEEAGQEEEVDQNEEAVVKQAIEEEGEVAIEQDDVQSEENPSEDVAAPTEDCENEQNDCCAGTGATAECCNDKPEEINDPEPTPEELSTSEVEQPQTTEEVEQPQTTEASPVEEPQTTETEVERPSAEVEQPPTQPPRSGFIFTVNPSVVPGSIIRTPERPSNKPQSSLYEDTPLGTAEV